MILIDQQSRRTGERGSVMVMTAILALGLCMAVGLCIDVARIYMVRSGLQNAADAAALAAARELNSGTAGLNDAVAQAQTAALQENKYGFNKTGSTPPAVTISKVEFAPTLNGPWYTGAGGVPSGSEATIKFVRVTTQTAAVGILFAVKSLGTSRPVTATATAGMSRSLNAICNFYPVAVALTNPNPANHATLTFNFTDGTGNSVTLANFGYTVLNVPDISGNGAPETANLAAGVTSLCASVGQSVSLNNSPSANSNNGPKEIADGSNTRFDSYRNGYANALNATAYPPDANIFEPLSATQYLNNSPSSAPSHTAQQDRRILIMPIIPPGNYTGSPPQVPITRFGAFLLRTQIDRTGNCNGNGPCAGAMKVDYLGDNFVIGRGYYDPNNFYDPNGSGSSLAKPVLYR
jgi:Flp pilus assembly protein TadG